MYSPEYFLTPAFVILLMDGCDAPFIFISLGSYFINSNNHSVYSPNIQPLQACIQHLFLIPGFHPGLLLLSPFWATRQIKSFPIAFIAK